jgi:hypothetical protein
MMTRPTDAAASRRLVRNAFRLLVEGDARTAGVSVEAALKAHDEMEAWCVAKDRERGFVADDDLTPPTAAEQAQTREFLFRAVAGWKLFAQLRESFPPSVERVERRIARLGENGTTEAIVEMVTDEAKRLRRQRQRMTAKWGRKP